MKFILALASEFFVRSLFYCGTRSFDIGLSLKRTSMRWTCGSLKYPFVCGYCFAWRIIDRKLNIYSQTFTWLHSCPCDRSPNPNATLHAAYVHNSRPKLVFMLTQFWFQFILRFENAVKLSASFEWQYRKLFYYAVDSIELLKCASETSSTPWNGSVQISHLLCRYALHTPD